VEVSDDRLIDFKNGLLGFSSYTQYILLQPDEDGVFYWLQSTEAAELAFVVTDPRLWVGDYEATIRTEQMEQLQLQNQDDAQVFVIVNKYDKALTANLQGPIIINLRSQKAMQLVLAEKRWNTRHEIVEITQDQAVSA
jgi:flagellar assembly factor FliW